MTEEESERRPRREGARTLHRTARSTGCAATRSPVSRGEGLACVSGVRACVSGVRLWRQWTDALQAACRQVSGTEQHERVPSVGVGEGPLHVPPGSGSERREPLERVLVGHERGDGLAGLP